jgi:hypothetical protein
MGSQKPGFSLEYFVVSSRFGQKPGFLGLNPQQLNQIDFVQLKKDPKLES